MKTTTTGKSKKSHQTNSRRYVTSRYLELIEDFPLRPISTKSEHQRALEINIKLSKLSRTGKLRENERDYFRVLGLLIEVYENKNYPLKKSTPGEMLEFLMDQHDLRQVDLVNELGSQAAVSFILNDKRRPTREQIAALAKRFRVSPSVFFED